MSTNWRYTAGERGALVTVYERSRGGPIYARAANGAGGYVRLSLGHRDRERAKLYALQQAAKIQEGAAVLRDGRLALSRLFALYLAHHTPNKSRGEQSEDRRRMKLWTRFLGAGKDVNKITVEEWRRFTRDRASGLLAADGSQPETPRPVRTRAVQRDLQWLKWCLKWATEWQDADGHYLLASNPVRGKQAYPIPAEKNVRRPVASTDRLEAVLAVAHPYLKDIMILVSETGRRISAVLTLQWGDIRWNAGPHGSIRWRSDSDKMMQEWDAPLSAAARAALESMLQRRPAIGNAYVFPSTDPRPGQSEKPITRARVRQWLLTAEKRAGLEKQDGSLFHAYRRAWVTARKHLPDRDVAAAGGWKGTEVLRTCYQQPDSATILRVVTGGLELREAK